MFLAFKSEMMTQRAGLENNPDHDTSRKSRTYISGILPFLCQFSGFFIIALLIQAETTNGSKNKPSPEWDIRGLGLRLLHLDSFYNESHSSQY